MKTFVHRAFLALAGIGFSIVSRADNGMAIATAGSAAASFSFSARALEAPAPSEFMVVPLPMGARGVALADDGTVLMEEEGFDETTESWTLSYFRWRNGRREPIEIPPGSEGTVDGRMNHRGDALLILSDGSHGFFALSSPLGAITHLGSGPYQDDALADFSNTCAVGFTTVGFTGNAEGESQSIGLWCGARWSLNGSAPVSMGEPNRNPSFAGVSPFRVNDAGDYLSHRWQGRDWQGDYFNEQLLPFSPYQLNNEGHIVGWSDEDYLPVFWDGEPHPLGNEYGEPVAINDTDDVLMNLDDGRVVLLRRNDDPQAESDFDAFDLSDALVDLRALRGTAINQSGCILLDVVDGHGETRSCLLIPASLDVDFDRDGKIDSRRIRENPDRGFIAHRLPYLFWVNDDNDSGDAGGDDIPGQSPAKANGANGHVDGLRDLLDFFPVYLNIGSALRAFPPEAGFTFRFAHADGALRFVLTLLLPEQADAYLKDPTVATSLSTATSTLIPPEGIQLSTDWLTGAAHGTAGVVLVEASAPTRAPLQLEVWSNTGKIGTIELPLSIQGVENMYRRKNLVGAARFQPEPGAESRPLALNYPDALCNDQWFVFLHGYNVNQQDARGWQSDVFKRLWWSGSHARFVGVTWAGSDSQVRFGSAHVSPNYHVNVVHAFETAEPFADFLRELSPTGAGLHVAAHSLGNMVASAAMATHGARVENYFLINAAVAAEAYDEASTQPFSVLATSAHTDWVVAGVYPPRFWATQWHDLFPANDYRHYLTWQNRFASAAPTHAYNFYSSGEEVLAEDLGKTPSLTGVVFAEFGQAVWNLLFGDDVPLGANAWAYQEKLKGGTLTNRVIGSRFGGWGFNVFDFSKKSGVQLGATPAMVPRELSAEEAAALSAKLSDADLRAEPFFDPGPGHDKLESWPEAAHFVSDDLADLYGEFGSSVAFDHRYRLLAEMIPAQSLAAGRIPVGRFSGSGIAFENFDLTTGFRTGWPSDRQGTSHRDRWMHSDCREVAYLYTHALTDKFVELGHLR